MREPERVAVVVIARGRHEHLRHQLRSLFGERVDSVVLVEMGDPGLQRVARHAPASDRVDVVAMEVDGSDLPLAAARNRGARAALEAGADVLVFLDVDCVVEPGTVERYVEVARVVSASPVPVVLAGEVGYLPADLDLDTAGFTDLAGVARFPPARPRPAARQAVPAKDLELFWSLSFAMTADHWRTAGGFDEAYVGYGAEDTDFGQRVARAGGSMLWVGGARAFHQHDGSQVPPVQHVEAIVRNANLFRRRWGWFPMAGWLQALESRGLVAQDGDRWVVTDREGVDGA